MANDLLVFKLFLSTVQEERKLRDNIRHSDSEHEKRRDKWWKFHYDVFFKQLREIKFPLSEEEMQLAAKTLDCDAFFFMLSEGDNYLPRLRNQLYDEYSDQRRALNAPHRAVFEQSAWKNPSCDPLRDEDKIETDYRRKYNIIWTHDHGKSLAQMAEDLYGLDWVTAYKAIMANNEGMFAGEAYAERRYWELRGEGSLHHQYRRAVKDYLWWCTGRDTDSFVWYRNRAISLRLQCRAAGEKTYA